MPRVLCIDDQAANLEIRKLVLERNGYSVLTATDGPTGVDLARKHKIDLVVLDYRMPRMDGEQVARILRVERPTLPIVLLSGYPGDIPDALLSIVDEFVQKGSGDLLAALKTVFKRRRSKRSA